MEGGDWVVIDLVKIYGLVFNNYVCGGGDGYKMFCDVDNVYDYGLDFVDVIVEYLVKVGFYMLYMDGWIV